MRQTAGLFAFNVLENFNHEVLTISIDTRLDKPTSDPRA